MKTGTKAKGLKKETLKIVPDESPKIIQNCDFVGVKYDQAATEALKSIAEGFIENAKGLGVLAKVLNASDVKIESMITIQ